MSHQLRDLLFSSLALGSFCLLWALLCWALRIIQSRRSSNTSSSPRLAGYSSSSAFLSRDITISCPIDGKDCHQYQENGELSRRPCRPEEIHLERPDELTHRQEKETYTVGTPRGVP